MLNKKLFKKLNEQMEINSILNEEATEEEIALVEESVIFGDANQNRINVLETVSHADNSKIEESK